MEKQVSSHSSSSDLDSNIQDSPELRLSKRLLWESRYNRWTALLNCISKAAGSLFQGRIQPLFEIPVDFVWGLYQTSQCTPWERKSLFLLDTYLRKNRQYQNRENLQHLVIRLQSKRMKQIFKQEYQLGCLFMKKDLYPRALFHLNNALDIDPQSRKVGNKILWIKSELARQERLRQSSLAVWNGEDFFLSQKEKNDYRRLIYSLLDSNSHALQELSSSFLFSHPDSNYNDDIQYTGILLDFPILQGSQIMDRMQQLSSNFPESNSSCLARNLLRDPEFHPFINLKRQEDQYHTDLRSYIFRGKRPLDENIYMVSERSIQYPGSAPMDIGIFFFLDMGYRTIDCLFGSPISLDELIKSLCVYERQYPDCTVINSLREKLSHVYAKKREYGRALEFARKVDLISPERLKNLSDKKTAAIYNMILEDWNYERKIQNLKRMLSLYPEVPIAKRARKTLEQLMEDDFYEFRLPKKVLCSYPILLNKEILDLDLALFDGDRKNGEMSDEGISAIKEGPVIYRIEGEGPIREIPLSPEIRQLVKSEIEFLGLSDNKDRLKDKNKERPFPFEVSGGLGTSGWEVFPSFVPLPYKGDDMDLFQ